MTAVAVPPTTRGTLFTQTAIWSALVLGSFIGWRLPIGGGRDINLTLFDAALPLALIYCLATGRIMMAKGGRIASTLSLRLGIGIVVAAVLILGHATYTYRYGAWTPIPRLGGPVQIQSLVRETVKLITILIELVMLGALFTVPELRRPPAWLLAILGVVIAAVMIHDRIQFFREGELYFANIAANSLAALMVLAISQLWSHELRSRLAALAWSIGVTLIMMIAIRKTYLMVSVIIVLLVALAILRDAVQRADAQLIQRIALLVGGGVVIILVAHLSMTYEFYLGHNPLQTLVTNVFHSSEVRFDIQLVAWHLLVVSFPIGIGIGQFGVLVPRIPEIADFGVLFTHNSILNLVTEMGFVGVILSAGLIFLIYMACHRGHWVSRLSRLTFFAIPMMFNDTHGLRMTILVLAFYAICAVPSEGKP